MSVYGLPGNEELYHWKYVRKYKKNGKWRYVYPNDKFGIKEAIDTKITGKAYRQHTGELYDAITRNSEALNRNALKRGSLEPGSFDEYKKLDSQDAALRASSKKISKVIDDVSYLNYSSLHGKASQAVRNGRNAVADWLEKLAKKVR